MGDPNHSQGWWEGLGKGFLYAVFVCIGVVVSVAMETQQAVMSRKKVIYRVVVSMAAGAIASFSCYSGNVKSWLSAIIVPCCTILGQEFFKWLVTGGWAMILAKIATLAAKKKE